MNLIFIFVLSIIVLLLLLWWALRTPGKSSDPSLDSSSLEQLGKRHVAFLSQIRQALAASDFEFLASRLSRKLTRRVRKERRRVVLAYLSALQEDFQKLLRLSRVIAVLSPEVDATQEFQRFRLTVQFTLQCQMIRARLLVGVAPLPQLGQLSQAVSGLAVRIETAIVELGERAALATELASSLERRGVNLN
jgi:hypothetical protein